MPPSLVLPHHDVAERLARTGAGERFWEQAQDREQSPAAIVADGIVHADRGVWEGFSLPVDLCSVAEGSALTEFAGDGRRPDGWCTRCLPYLWGSGRFTGLPAVVAAEAALLVGALTQRAERTGLGGYELLVAARLLDVLQRRWRDSASASRLARELQQAVAQGVPALGTPAAAAAATEIIEGWATRSTVGELLAEPPDARPAGTNPSALWGVMFTRSGVSASPNTELGEFPPTSAAVLLATGQQYEGKAVVPVDEGAAQLVSVVPRLLERHRAEALSSFRKIGITTHSVIARTNEPFDLEACQSAATLWSPERTDGPLADLETVWRLSVLHARTQGSRATASAAAR